MIIVNLKDGLGNQLFEYAFAKVLQKRSGEKIVLNNFFFDGAKRRCYSLNHFRLNENVKVLGRPMQIWYTFCYLVRLFLCYPRVFINWMISNQRPKDEKTFAHSAKQGLYVHFNTFHQFDIPISKRKNKYVYGNYENYCYVQEVLSELMKEFEIVTPPSDQNREMMRKLSSEESVCVHIRRGDYLDPRWKMMNVCTFEYYQNSLNEIQRLHPNAKFYVFSNTHEDLLWIKKNYHFTQALEYVDLSNPDYEELRLMQQCKHFVISNSTFSWWAALLAKAEHKTVVAPQKWIHNDESGDSNGMLLPEWLLFPLK